MDITKETLKKNIEEIKKEIVKYSPQPEKVKFVAVTKYVDNNIIEKLLELDINTFGENKAQVIKEKEEYFSNKNISWHFIGNLQKNKVKYIARFVSLIHSINKLSLAKEIDKRAKEHKRKIDVLLEINVSGEESKEGYQLDDLLLDIPELLKLENINIIGLMTMAPFTDDVNIIRNSFRQLRYIKDELNKSFFEGRLTELSMGMSNDYRIALEEGATLIRIGSKIYD